MTPRVPSSTDLQPTALKVALLHPQIAPNTGNIARTCVATGCQLHLIRPLGFVLSDRNLRRSAMDYWPRLQLSVHEQDTDFFNALRADRASPWLFSSKGRRSLWDVQFTEGDWLVFGNETAGIPGAILAGHLDRVVRIPQAPAERCLNLSAAVSIVLYEALRQTQSATINGLRIGDAP